MAGTDRKGPARPLKAALLTLAGVIGGGVPALAVKPQSPMPVCSPDLTFTVNDATLSAHHRKRLDDFVSQCLTPEKTIEIKGFADNSELPAFAHDRAESVRNYLLSKGVPSVSMRLVVFENNRTPNKSAKIRTN